MRALIVVLSVGLMLIVSSGLALAAPPPWAHGGKHGPATAAQTAKAKGNKAQAGQKRAKIAHVVGQVTAYTAATDSANGSITVQPRKGGAAVTLTVTKTTKIHLPAGISGVANGQQVTVVGTKDRTATARGIAVHGPETETEKD